MADYSVTVEGKLTGFEKLDEIEQKINSLRNKTVNVKVNVSGAKNISNFIDNLTNSASASKQYTNAGKSAAISYTTALQDQIEAMARTQRTAFSSPLNTITKKESDYNAFWQRELKKSDDARQKIINQATGYSSNVNNRGTALQLSTLQTKASGIDSGVDNYNNLSAAIQKCVTAEQELNAANSAFVSNGSVENANQLTAAYNNFSTALKTANNELKITNNNASLTADAKKVTDFQTKLQKYYDANPKMWSKYGEQVKGIISGLDAGKTSTNDFKKFQSQFSDIQKNVVQEGLTGSSALYSLKSSFSAIFRFASMYGVIQRAMFQVPQQIISAVREVNAAQVELAKVTDLPASKLNSYWDEATESAKKYGSTISDIISTTADWSRLGMIIAPLYREV